MLTDISNKCPHLTEMVVHLPTVNISILLNDCAHNWTRLEKLHLLGESSSGKEIQMEHLLPFVKICLNLSQIGWRSRVWKVHRYGQDVRLDLYKQIYIPSVFSVCTEYPSRLLTHDTQGYSNMIWRRRMKPSVHGKMNYRIVTSTNHLHIAHTLYQ